MKELSTDEIYILRNQDGLHKKSIFIARPKIEVKMEVIELMAEKRMRTLKELEHLFDKDLSPETIRSIAVSAYEKILHLMENENEQRLVDYLIPHRITYT